MLSSNPAEDIVIDIKDLKVADPQLLQSILNKDTDLNNQIAQLFDQFHKEYPEVNYADSVDNGQSRQFVDTVRNEANAKRIKKQTRDENRTKTTVTLRHKHRLDIDKSKKIKIFY